MLGSSVVGTNDIDKAKAFYDALFATIDVGRMMEFERLCAWGQAPGQPWFGVIKPLNEEPATVGNGSMVGLSMPSREAVDTIHAKALELGGSDEGAPGPRGPDGAFYAAYFRDPEGHKLLAFAVPA